MPLRSAPDPKQEAGLRATKPAPFPYGAGVGAADPDGIRGRALHPRRVHQRGRSRGARGAETSRTTPRRQAVRSVAPTAGSRYAYVMYRRALIAVGIGGIMASCAPRPPPMTAEELAAAWRTAQERYPPQKETDKKRWGLSCSPPDVTLGTITCSTRSVSQISGRREFISVEYIKNVSGHISGPYIYTHHPHNCQRLPMIVRVDYLQPNFIEYPFSEGSLIGLRQAARQMEAGSIVRLEQFSGVHCLGRRSEFDLTGFKAAHAALLQMVREARPL